MEEKQKGRCIRHHRHPKALYIYTEIINVLGKC